MLSPFGPNCLEFPPPPPLPPSCNCSTVWLGVAFCRRSGGGGAQCQLPHGTARLKLVRDGSGGGGGAVCALAAIVSNIGKKGQHRS